MDLELIKPLSEWTNEELMQVAFECWHAAVDDLRDTPERAYWAHKFWRERRKYETELSRRLNESWTYPNSPEWWLEIRKREGQMEQLYKLGCRPYGNKNTDESVHVQGQ